MANTANIGFESELWLVADKLRSNMDPEIADIVEENIDTIQQWLEEAGQDL